MHKNKIKVSIYLLLFYFILFHFIPVGLLAGHGWMGQPGPPDTPPLTKGDIPWGLAGLLDGTKTRWNHVLAQGIRM